MWHILLYCLRYDQVELLLSYSTKRLEEILEWPECVKHVVYWWLRLEIMEQFRVVVEVEDEDVTSFRAFQEEEE